MMKLQIAQRPSGVNLRSVRTFFVNHGDAAAATRIKATFSIKRRVNYGDSLAIIGENAELGSWKVSGAKKMTWGEGDVWQGEVELDSGTQVQYKYLIIDKHGKNIVWLPGENFILSIPEATSDMISIQDSWDGHDRKVIIDENKGVDPSASASASSSVAPTILDSTHGLPAAPEGPVIGLDQAATARVRDGQDSAAPLGSQASQPITIGKLEITVEAGSALPFNQNGNGNGHHNGNGNGNGNGHHSAATAVAEAEPATAAAAAPTIEAITATPAAPAIPHTEPGAPQEEQEESAPGPRNTLSGQEIASLPSLTVRELRALAEKLGVEHSGVGKNLLLRRVQNKIKSML